MKSFLAAVRFLTIVPLPAGESGEETHLSRSVPFFPVIGLLIGLGVATLDAALFHLFPPFLTSVFVVIVLIAVSGGLHLDGLADTADGIFSSRPPEQMLEIMRDSRTGPMGVAALVCVIALKIAAIGSIEVGRRWAALLMVPLAGRCALVILLILLPYARSEGGLATVFQKNKSTLQAIWAIVLLALVGWLSAGSAGLVMAAVSIAGILLFAGFIYARIGGTTGDTLGAACEIVEALPAIVAVAASHAL
jgi:adenosylcobinamide-GDP ribazoletransferase